MFFHRVFLHMNKIILFTIVRIYRPFYRMVQCLGRGIVKFETVALSCLMVVIDDRIVKASGGSDDGQCSVPQGVDLVQAAGFEQRRHQKEVTSRFDLMGKCVAVPDVASEFLRMFLCHMAEKVFSPELSVPQHHDLYVHFKQSFYDRGNKLYALLCHKPPYKADKRDILPQRQSKPFLKVPFAHFLFQKCIDIIVGCDIAVYRRIPFCIVDPVEYAVEFMGMSTQMPVQAKTEFRCLYLFGIFFTDRRQRITESDTAF
ncbi:hypothetical protein MNB_SV-10-1061 [hydrothermal vent metagenome]|uniref:Uncharacterized protein n=1 Tax=hydrothermal vent metagenome TaxID=652676 RepID=A0A1W1CSJ2_9ZZZZ